jgi:hypothetical protein
MIGDKKAEGYARCIGSPFWVCAYLSAVAVKKTDLSVKKN